MARRGQNRRVYGRYRGSQINLTTVRYEDFGGGLNNNSSPFLIDDNQSPDLLNVVLDERGAVIKRKGLRLLLEIANCPNGIQGMFYASNAGTTYLLIAAGGKVYTTDQEGVTVTEIMTLASSTTIVDFAQLLGAVYIAESGQVMKKWDFTTVTTPTGSKAVNVLRRWRNGLWGVSSGTNGSTDNTSRLLYTNALSDNLSDQFIDIEKQDGDDLVAIEILGRQMVAWKQGSTHRLFWNETFTILYREVIDDSNGTIAQRTVRPVENTYAYLTRGDGIKKIKSVQFIDDLTTERMDEEISPFVDLINEQYAARACGGFFRNKYQVWIPIGQSEVNSLGFVYDDRYKKWVKWDNWSPACFVRYVGRDKTERFYMGDQRSGKVYQVESGYSDAGNAYNSFWKSKQFDLGAGELDKFLRYLDVVLKGVRGTVTINIYVDEVLFTTASILTTITAAGGSMGAGRHLVGYKTAGRSTGVLGELKQFIQKRISVAGTDEENEGDHAIGKRIQVEVRNDTADESWGLLGFNFHTKAYDRARFNEEDII